MIDTPGEQTGMCECSHHIPCHVSLHHRLSLGGQVVCTAGNGADSMKLGHSWMEDDGNSVKICEGNFSVVMALGSQLDGIFGPS